jgi:hypothetical protein
MAESQHWSRTTWTDEEDAYLIKHASTMTYAQMAKALHRDMVTVRARCQVLGVGRAPYPSSSVEAQAYVQANYKTMMNKHIAAHLGVSIACVRGMAKRMGLSKVPRWSGGDDQFIMDNWQKMSDAEMATSLTRTENAVELRRLGMGLLRG